ncbi:MAG: hypothetical protein JSR48_05175 [Verrucomicrobia bacterium]|nr:hypothetical protein [Verrucomicrobiota bacterium]
MKPSPEQLEKMIHETLRSLPAHRAPRSLEARVLAALESRAALPWWRQSFVRWPMAARVAFVLLSAGLAKVALMVTVWVMAGFDSTEVAGAFSSQFAWVASAAAVINHLVAFCGTVYRGIPPLWLYGGIAFVAMMYLALFGLGAAAYRTLYANR